MNGNWVDTTIGSLLDKGAITIQTGPFGSQLHSSDYEPEGIPVILTESIGRRRLITDDVPYVSPETANRLSRHKLRPGDILFARRGAQATGLSALVEEKHAGWLCGSGAILLRVNDPNIDPSYLSFVLSTDSSIEWLKQHAVGAVMPNLNETVIRGLHIPIPNLGEQRTITGILSVLDDKIELNSRMNGTLESLARAIFRQWFVENEETNNWKEINLGHFADVIDCMHTKKPDREPAGKPLIQLWNILDNGLLDMTDTYFITEEKYKHWTSRVEASPGDCVITNTGRVAAIAQIPEGYNAALGRNMTGIRCKKTFPYPTFLLECLRSDTMRQEIDRKTDVGTILNSLNVRNIPTLQFRLPPNELMEHFEKTVRPIRAMMEKNLAQSRTLASLRDSLLPKLMRGEVRVKEL